MTDNEIKPGDQPELTDEDLSATDNLQAPKETTREALANAASDLERKAQGEPVQAPAHWKDDDKKFFSGIKDRAVQDYLLKRNKEFEAGSTKWGTENAELRKQFEPIQKLFAPYADHLKQNNVTIAQVVGNYLQAEQALRTKPVEALLHLAKTYNVTPTQLIEALSGKGGAQPQQEQIDPALKPLVDRLGRLETAEQQRARMAVESQESTLTTALGWLESVKGNDGAVLFPHATNAEIRRAMSIIIGSGEVDIAKAGGVQQALVQAYGKAIRLNDDTHKAFLESAIAAQTKKTADANAERVKKAKAAGGSLSGGSTAAARPGFQKGSTRESLERAARESGFIQ